MECDLRRKEILCMTDSHLIALTQYSLLYQWFNENRWRNSFVLYCIVVNVYLLCQQISFFMENFLFVHSFIWLVATAALLQSFNWKIVVWFSLSENFPPSNLFSGRVAYLWVLACMHAYINWKRHMILCKSWDYYNTTNTKVVNIDEFGLDTDW